MSATLSHEAELDWLMSAPGEPEPDVLAVLAALLHRPAWHADAACRDTAVDFFPRRGESIRAAVAVCAACPVAAECRGYALEVSGLHGIWGGASARTRRTLKQHG